MYLMTSTRCGISAKQLERELGVTYKTAWRMAKEIRHTLMEQEEEPLSGTIEADETYIGGKRRGTKRGRAGADSHKVPVFGMVERQGEVRVMTIPNAKRATLLPQVRKHVIPTSVIYTDEWQAYNPLPRLGYRHGTINHSEATPRQST